SEEGKKMMSNPFSARKHLNRLIYPMMRDAMFKFHLLSKENEVVLFHVKAMADYYADGLNCKFIRTNVVPAIEPTREFINPIVSFSGLPSFMNRLSYKLSDLGMKMMSKPIKQFRQSIGLNEKHTKLNLPSIYGLSNYFLSRPKDYPADSYYTGFWFENSKVELEKELAGFISNGEPPLLLTFGSMPSKSKLNLPKALQRITKELNTRLVVIKGWGLENTEELQNNPAIKVVESAPYDKLMPHIKAAVHHGGIGTVAECLRAGKPFLTCPVLYPLGDQHFWGTVAYKKGLGLRPIPLKKLDEDKLVAAVRELLNNKQLYANSQKIMEQLKGEDGVANAINVIESIK
ncbi:MAG TPA: glycosyltransferase, partial [Chitinophagaceae bacterium]|nr:glycosyltransferase [Chitinophagaceae bacterium]